MQCKSSAMQMQRQCNALQMQYSSMQIQYNAIRCKCNAMHCNALQCNATQMQCKCNAMQHLLGVPVGGLLAVLGQGLVLGGEHFLQSGAAALGLPAAARHVLVDTLPLDLLLGVVQVLLVTGA